ncbi:H-NS family nucleoid-associated regulatory protein [Caballeronia sp. S22]|uniref:H-NS family nucleoid-associated regulatory protein n=1 Tax=Caballeronia sp. S22 TaxID=3137182 RepID=UPI0035306DA8
MATLESIEAKIATLQSQADAITKKKSTKVIAEIHALMSEHGITVDDLGTPSGGEKHGSRMANTSDSDKKASNAKYRDPKSGATWSGHGRSPSWIASAKSRDKFLIDGGASNVSIAAKNPPKAVGNYVRGPQPALYRDPKSGAEWSGRGRAPAWLASAKNRDRFLIDGNATTTRAADKTSAMPAGNYIRGPQPAKYRDPKSGAEWSGRGKAPGWLASAKDRTKFLIDGPANTATAAKQGTPKADAAKKAGAKKTTSRKSAKKAVAKKSSATTVNTPASKKAAEEVDARSEEGALAERKKIAAKKVASRKSREYVGEGAPDPAKLLTVSPSNAEAITSTA